jgi:hypothetical protein
MYTQYIHSLPQSRLGTANYAIITVSQSRCTYRAQAVLLVFPGNAVNRFRDS